MKPLALFVFSVFLALLAPTLVSANIVTFDFEALGTVYGAPAGDSPGDLVFSEDMVDVYVVRFFESGNPYFNGSRIEPPQPAPFFFGSGHILNINNIGMTFDFGAPGNTAFQFLYLGGTVNLQVNGHVLHEAPDFSSLIGVVAPGVTLNVMTNPVPGGVKGVAILNGPVEKLVIGGQELWIDEVNCDNGIGGPVDDCEFLVHHESLAIGDSWGVGLNAPGDYMFTESGIDVYIEEFFWGTGWGFHECFVSAPGIAGFGSGRVMEINNVNNHYDISTLGQPVSAVTFEYVDFGGMENLRVNGSILHHGDMPTFAPSPAPGVLMSVATYPIPFGERGVVTLMGDIQDLWIGGQEFMVDNICVHLAEPPQCDHLSDNESQPLHTFYGAGHGHAPGDWIFNEDGIDIFVTEFDTGTSLEFSEAYIDNAFSPAGSGQVLVVGNIGILYKLDPLGNTSTVSFEFFDGAGVENLGVNGLLFVGEFEAIPAGFYPGVAINVETFAGPGYQYGTVTLTGDVDELIIGGQQFYLDNVCVELGGETAVTEGPTNGLLPALLELPPNAPNPFNPSTTLFYNLGRPDHVRLTVHDMAGRLVRTLVDEQRDSGGHEVIWNGRDDSGREAATGLYLVRVSSGGETRSRKIALLK